MKSYKHYSLICGCGLLFMSVTNAYASQHIIEKQADKTTAVHVNQKAFQFSGHLGIGYLSGQSQELVYNPESHQRISKLEWDLTDVYMANIGGSVTFNDWLTFNVDYSTKLNDGNGDMDDYDWDDNHPEWSMWSNSDTKLKTGYMIDLNTEIKFYQYNSSKFNALIGYKRDSWKWEDRGGTYVYSTNSFRDSTGTFPDEKGITYSQWYDIPYIGIGFESRISNFSLTGEFIYSPLVYAGDEDIHHARELKFDEDFDTTTMFAVRLGGSYFLTETLSLQLTYNFQQYKEAKGSTTVTDLSTGETEQIDGDAAGTNHKSNLVNLALVYDF